MDDMDHGGHPMFGLTFNALRQANVARLPTFKNAKGEPAHSKPDGSDWCLAQWSNAVTGELGEAANLIKKVERGDLTLDEARPLLAKEFADVATYLDILAFRAGVDLGDAVLEKFNEVSARVGSPVRLFHDHVETMKPEGVHITGRASPAFTSGPVTCADATSDRGAALKIEDQFEVGRLVWLKSGGPSMTILGVDCCELSAAWFTQDGQLHNIDLHPAAFTTNRPLQPGDMF